MIEMNRSKKLTITLSDNEYQYIKDQSQICNMSINAYAKRKILDRADTIYLQKEATAVMAGLYDLEMKTEDMQVRKWLRKYGDDLCHCLK
jgi:hypothetical protein